MGKGAQQQQQFTSQQTSNVVNVASTSYSYAEEQRSSRAMETAGASSSAGAGAAAGRAKGGGGGGFETAMKASYEEASYEMSGRHNSLGGLPEGGMAWLNLLEVP
jgi:hypothetical protein